MSWEKHETSVAFYCDGPECNQNISAAADFVPAWIAVQNSGWRSFKKVGQPWQYFCPKCAPAAEEAQRKYRESENERDRIRSRNARFN